jgi:hypothetical protein
MAVPTQFWSKLYEYETSTHFGDSDFCGVVSCVGGHMAAKWTSQNVV